jgi:hypothetical protein
LTDQPQAGLFGAEEPSPPPAPTGPHLTIYVHFEDVNDLAAFGKLLGQRITTETRWLCYPPDELFPERSIGALAAVQPEPEEEDGFGLSETKATQAGLFGDAEWWEEYWRGMPEFDQRDLAPRHSIQMDFKTRADVEAFEKLLDQKIPDYSKRTASIWYPEAEIGRFADKRYRAAKVIDPRYPVYIISKGRWESRLTAKSLDKMGVPYNIVIEPQEYDAYAAVIDPDKILTLPFSNLGQGSIPARNWCWEHSVNALGAKRHWILDDNIDGFYRLNKNLKTPVADGTIFRCAEDFADRYENVAISGFHYFMFASRKTKMPPFTLNSRVYSMILIQNDIPFRWRGRYNEDTDLSIRALKAGYCTVLYLAFLGMKSTTMTMKGGNSDQLYKDDGRRKMAESLVEQHPDITKITWKWGRWQHHVDYSSFKRNKLVPRAGLVVPEGVDNYGMVLEIDSEKKAA